MRNARGLKTQTIAARFTPRQYDKLEKIAIVRDTTISEVLRDLVDDLTMDVTVSNRLQAVQQNEAVLA